ncbi:hypothetical protein F5144DRAFT_578308 [Chaetomium tenue]|uniref:Uncharacterized protein n=1 Tax=Chaetomium tenue TaxID=1854479 RepID=A0ACB7P4S8_9PEZI|nr:hypothetical protein F5144DRAFT_578308 [Chaetomium globosum]
MKFATSTLALALATLAAAVPAPAAEPDAASMASGLEARQSVNWYGVRDVSQIALDRLNGGLADAINNLGNEVAPAGGGLAQAMNDVYTVFSQMNNLLNTIHNGAVSIVGP